MGRQLGLPSTAAGTIDSAVCAGEGKDWIKPKARSGRLAGAGLLVPAGPYVAVPRLPGACCKRRGG